MRLDSRPNSFQAVSKTTSCSQKKCPYKASTSPSKDSLQLCAQFDHTYNIFSWHEGSWWVSFPKGPRNYFSVSCLCLGPDRGRGPGRGQGHHPTTTPYFLPILGVKVPLELLTGRWKEAPGPTPGRWKPQGRPSCRWKPRASPSGVSKAAAEELTTPVKTLTMDHEPVAPWLLLKEMGRRRWRQPF